MQVNWLFHQNKTIFLGVATNTVAQQCISKYTFNENSWRSNHILIQLKPDSYAQMWERIAWILHRSHFQNAATLSMLSFAVNMWNYLFHFWYCCRFFIITTQKIEARVSIQSNYANTPARITVHVICLLSDIVRVEHE